jgi:hypothetical protein
VDSVEKRREGVRWGRASRALEIRLVLRVTQLSLHRARAAIPTPSKKMDFSDLSEALGNHAVWIYLSAVVVAVCEVTTGSELLNPQELTLLVKPVADAAGLDLLSPHVYRACLRKILMERFVPLARVLRDAFSADPLEFEEGVPDLFDPIAQETVTNGFRINSAGVTVLSLQNLVRWVLVNGMRNPGGFGFIASIDRVRRFDVPFSPTDHVFLQHLFSVDTVLVPCLDSVAHADSIVSAHGTLTGMLQSWEVQSFAEREALVERLSTFLDFWVVPADPPMFTHFLNQLPPVMQEADAHAGAYAQAVAYLAAVQPQVMQIPHAPLAIVIPPVDVDALLNDEEEDEEGEEERDTDDEESDDEGDIPVIFVE